MINGEILSIFYVFAIAINDSTYLVFDSAGEYMHRRAVKIFIGVAM